MKKIILFVAFMLPFTVKAQVSQAKFDSLLARVDFLDSVVNTRAFQSEQIACTNLEANRPTTWFTNGEYNLAFRNRQFGCAFDPVASAVAQHDVTLNRQGASIVDLQSKVATLLASTPPVVNDNGTMFATKLILGDCKNKDSNSQIQICGLGDASIYFESNLSTLQWQNPSYHVGTYGLAGDGGLKGAQNCYGSTVSHQEYDPVGGVYYQSSLKCSVDATRENSFFGTDSRGRINYQLVIPGFPHEYTQDLILNIEPYTKAIQWQSMQSGYHFENLTSATSRGLEYIHVVPKQ